MRELLGPLLLFSALLAGGCAGRPVPPEPRRPETIRIQIIDNGRATVNDVPLEAYVTATALSEFAPAAGDAGAVEAMYEVQAVVARTYAESHRGRHATEGFDLCATTHCQLYEPARLATSRWAAAARQAARQTEGLVLGYGGAVADAVYHSDCGGWTSAAADVWGGAGLPYLRAQPDDGDAAGAHRPWQYAVDAAALQRALATDPRTRVNGRLASMVVVSRDGAGRVAQLRLRGDDDPAALVVRGVDLREVLTGVLGVRTMRSTRFEVVRTGARFVFSGQGFGHGVGLCQVGALARVTAGGSPAAVLLHYYPGTVLADAGTLRRSSRRPPG